MQRIAEYIESNLEGDLSLQHLASLAKLSPFHFQRQFKAALGVTPKQYAEACRLRMLRKELRSGEDVLSSMFAAGYNSSSRIYEKIDTRLGMTPAEYRSGGKQIPMSYVAVTTALGLLMIAATDRDLCFVQFGDDEAALESELRREYPNAHIAPMHKPWPEPFHAWITSLESHLKGKQPRLDLPLDIRATAFQMAVWRYLQSIPYGEIQSYKEVAEGMGKPKAIRAVASACARNVAALVIPCHRVLRGTGHLGGYKWGLDRKRVLLDLERTTKLSD